MILRACIIIFALFPVLMSIYWNSPMEYHNGRALRDKFMVSRGDTLMTIVDNLKSKALVRNSVFAYYYGRILFLLFKGIHSGTYQIGSDMTTAEIMHMFFHSQSVPTYITLTVPEGYNIYSLAELFVKRNLVKTADEFFQLVFDKVLVDMYNIGGNSLEGYLYPATYYISPGSGAREVLVRMLDTFARTFPESFFRNAPFGLNRHQVVAMASLVEKETSLDAERKIVASVFYNRLKQNMRMACDPTVIYALLRAERYQGNLSRKRGDLDVRSPYNTYLYKGLPPSPIANPGKASLEAAMNPSDTEYLFFVAQDYKRHAFAHTFREHSRNVQKYREWMRSIKNNNLVKKK